MEYFFVATVAECPAIDFDDVDGIFDDDLDWMWAVVRWARDVATLVAMPMLPSIFAYFQYLTDLDCAGNAPRNSVPLLLLAWLLLLRMMT